MAKLYLEVRHTKKQLRNYSDSYYSKCPSPQGTHTCQGLYVKTRRYQKECISCMKLHGTIDKHKLLSFLLPKKECDIL